MNFSNRTTLYIVACVTLIAGSIYFFNRSTDQVETTATNVSTSQPSKGRAILSAIPSEKKIETAELNSRPEMVPDHNVDLDLASALQAFGAAIDSGEHDLSANELRDVDLLIAKLQQQSELEAEDDAQN